MNTHGNRRIHLFVILGLVVTASALTIQQAGGSDATSDRVRFNRDIRPILSDKCYACHGPDKATR